MSLNDPIKSLGRVRGGDRKVRDQRLELGLVRNMGIGSEGDAGFVPLPR